MPADEAHLARTPEKARMFEQTAELFEEVKQAATAAWNKTLEFMAATADGIIDFAVTAIVVLILLSLL